MPIVVTDYDPRWRARFERLRATIWPTIADVAITIEHVGSTSVQGLAAKPIIDMTIVVEDDDRLGQVISRLNEIGYRYRGDLGVTGREAFANPGDTAGHHLYACVQGCLALRNHVMVRDRLRRDPSARVAYGRLKKQLAKQFAHDLDAYVDGKTRFVLSLLREGGMTAEEMQEITEINALSRVAT